MRKSRFSETQIVKILGEVESGRSTQDVCREYGISPATFYNWKRKYGGMSAADVRRLHDLEEENRKLKQMYATLSLDHQILKEVLEKALSPAGKRELISELRRDFVISERVACRVLNVSRSAARYTPDPERDLVVIEALQKLVKQHPRFGFIKLFKLLRKAGHPWNHKRVHRIYCQLRLNYRRRGKQRLPSRNPEPLAIPGQVNDSWSMDFVSDSLWNGRRFRSFTLLDDCSREALAIECDHSLPAERVVRVLETVSRRRGYPRQVRSDNGPEFISLAMAQWAEDHGIHLEFIKPGKPTQNALIERFNRTYREEVLDYHAFTSLHDVRQITEEWIHSYNHTRPHQALDFKTPAEIRREKQAGKL